MDFESIVVYLLYSFTQTGVPTTLESGSYGGKKVDGLLIGLTRLGGGVWLPYTFMAGLLIYCLYTSIKGFYDHFKGRK